MDTKKDLKRDIEQRGNQGTKKEEKMGMRQDTTKEARSGEKDMRKDTVRDGGWYPSRQMRLSREVEQKGTNSECRMERMRNDDSGSLKNTARDCASRH